MAIATGCAPQRIAPQTPPSSPLDQLAWMTGRWITDGADGTITEEYWMPPRGGTMLGMGRSVDLASHRMTFFEYLRLEARPEGVTYWASPNGKQPATAFHMIESITGHAIFENPQHDYPRTIDYWRDGDLLHGRIEGVEKGEQRSEQWTWRLIR